MTNVFDDWRCRWSQLAKNAGRWVVITGHTTHGGTPWPTIRPVRWWSPRDLIRFPLHFWWARKFW